jgi:uncharacterized protein YyaL (SSP411 family)
MVRVQQHIAAANLDLMFELLQRNFDTYKGGMDRAPKFPMPSIYKFLLRYYDISQNPEAIAATGTFAEQDCAGWYLRPRRRRLGAVFGRR